MQNGSKPAPVRYARPSALKFRRGVTLLVRSDIAFAAVQVFTQGGAERNVHFHDALDGFWFVLSGSLAPAIQRRLPDHFLTEDFSSNYYDYRIMRKVR